MATKKQDTTQTNFAVIELSGKQFVVREGDHIVAEKLTNKVGDQISVKEVLLVQSNEKTQVGTPYVDSASVELKVEEEMKADKVEIRTFKAKSRERGSMGHRQIKTKLLVVGINLK